MESGGGSAAAVKEGSSSSAMAAPVLDEEAMWQLNLRGNEAMEPVPYPERPGVPDCAYYIRTGLCRFGMTCKFNHPPNRNLAAAIIRMKELYPERVGQPECQYYLKTGTCKFGSTCKFHHPKDKAGVAGRVQLNMLGYPLRPHETECAYYLRTGMCKFGSTCKFDHPQPSNAMVSLRGSLVYPTVHSPSTPGQQSYPGGLTNWPLSRASLIPSPRWQGTSSYTQGVLPQGLVQIPGWSPYPGQQSAVSSQESLQQSPGMSQFYSTSRQNEAATLGSPEAFSSYRISNTPVGIYALQRDNIFPERPDQPECQFYMKTGDCKFGATCKFHHPRERSVPIPNCMLSPLGLPIRPGEPYCIFYSRYGVCKFGPNCKFDHPMGNFTYTTSTSATVDAQADRHMLASSSGSALTSPTEGPSDSNPSSSRRHSVSSSHQMTSGVNNLKTGGSHTTSSNVQVSSFS